MVFFDRTIIMNIKRFLIWMTNNITNIKDGGCHFELRSKAADLSLRDARLLREVLTQVLEELDL